MGNISDVGDASDTEEYDEERLLVEASDEKLYVLLFAIISSIVGDVEITINGSLLTSGRCCCSCSCCCCCCCCSVVKVGTKPKLNGAAAAVFVIAAVDDVGLILLFRDREDVFKCCECI